MKRLYLIYVVTSCVLCLLASCSSDIDLQENQQEKNKNTVSLKNDNGIPVEVGDDYSYIEEEAEEIGIVYGNMLAYSFNYLATDEDFLNVFYSEDRGGLRDLSDIQVDEWWPYAVESVTSWATPAGYGLIWEVDELTLQNMMDEAIDAGEYSYEQQEFYEQMMVMLESDAFFDDFEANMSEIENNIWSLPPYERYGPLAAVSMLRNAYQVIYSDLPDFGIDGFSAADFACYVTTAGIGRIYKAVAVGIVAAFTGGTSLIPYVVGAVVNFGTKKILRHVFC